MKRAHAVIAGVVLSGLLVQQAGAYLLDNEPSNLPKTAPVRAKPLSPLELLANDKERESVLVKTAHREEAKIAFGGDFTASRAKLEKVAQSIAPLIFAGHRACEITVLKEIERLNSEFAIVADPRDLKSVLVALRELSLVDDLIFLPLNRAIPAYLENPAFEPQGAPAGSQGSDSDETPKPLSPEARRARELFAGLRGICPTDAYVGLRSRLKDEIGRKKFGRRDVKLEIRDAEKAGELSAQEAKWLLSLHRADGADFFEVPFTISSVAPKIRAVKNLYLKDENTATNPNSVSSRKKPKSGGLSYRIALYQEFEADQIKALSNIYFRYLWRTNHLDSASVVSRYKGDEQKAPDGTPIPWTDEVDPLSLQGQSNLLLAKLYKSMKDDAVRDAPLTRNVNFYEHVIVAVMETGYRDGEEIERILKVDEVWNPKEKTWDKILRVVTRYGGPALVVVPPPWNALASMTLALLNSNLLKGGKSADAEQPNFPIF